MFESEQRQAGAQIEEIIISSKMIEAGVYEAKSHTLGDLENLVHSIFIAMITEQRMSSPRQPNL
jgi:hypothetical protein